LGESTPMAMSSGIKRKQQVAQPAPVNLSLHNGFGSGFRFHYDSNTSQSEWARGKYHTANDSHAKPDTRHAQLPELIAKDRSRNEDELDIYDRLAFNVELATRYHSRRHQHYERAFRMIMLGIVVLTTFAFISSINTRVVLGLSILGLAVGTFVWNILPLSRLHDVLRGEYQSLLDHMRLHSEPTENDMRHWRNVHLRIRSKEPPLYWAIADECYDETARAWNLSPKPRMKLPWMMRPFINWWRF
jgi:hypothetical protein